jgi:hypothetical protein
MQDFIIIQHSRLRTYVYKINIGDQKSHFCIFLQNVLRQTIEHQSPDNQLANMFVEDVELFGMSQMPTGVTGDVGSNVYIAFDAINQKVSLLNAHIPADINYVVVFTFN